jgi:hypothetical protein
VTGNDTLSGLDAGAADGRDVYRLNVGGPAIEQAVANAFLEAVTSPALEAMPLTV